MTGRSSSRADSGRAGRGGLWLLLLAAVVSACEPAGTRVLVVYTSFPIEVAEAAEDALESMWADADVRMVVLDDETAYERLSSGSGQGDVWWGASAEILTRAAEENLLATFRPSWVEAGSETAGLDSLDRWQAVAISPLVIAFNRELTPLARAPRDWVDLFHPRWREEVMMLDPARHDAARVFVGGMVAHAVEEDGEATGGFDRLTRLDAAVAAYVSDADAIRDVLRSGEATLSVLPAHEAERLRHDDNAWLHYRHPDSGAPVMMRGVAMLTGAPERELAEELIELTGGQLSADVAVHTWWLPARGSLAEGRLPEGHFVAGSPIPWWSDPQTFFQELPGWLERWGSEVRGQGRNLH